MLDQARHELSCSACGAPLHDMKFMPISPAKPEKRAESMRKPTPYRPSRRKFSDDDKRRNFRKPVKQKKRKPLSRKIFEELWDVVEDIFD
ncbi:hypothetical protein [uncultured Roseovarius sp.]|uniref:hypothetical protein n=1 Tax=uncultured Roseovarius sp. TaxID=293344 RepID=UPI00261BA13A|nr:hypothetical protein [uncultured Roseovarius sp.]